MTGQEGFQSVLNSLLRMYYSASLSLSLCHFPITVLLSQPTLLPPTLQRSYFIDMEISSSSSSTCRVGAGARRPPPPPLPPLLLLRSVRAGREALAGGGPREEEEWEEEEGKGATVALTLLFAPSWRPWFCVRGDNTRPL